MHNLLWILFDMFVLLHFTSVDAVTLTGSSQYAVPGSGFTLTCDVPEKANAVWFFRRSVATSPEGVVQVGGDQCYNSKVAPPVPCTSDVCSCVASGGLGTVFRWIIQPQTGDHGSVWFCRRTNTNLPNQTLDSAGYTLSIADAVTMTGSSQYAVPGSGFTLTCDVPEKAQAVRFYRRPEVTSPEGAIQVGGDQCYNINVASPVLCTLDVCSCVVSEGLGTVFQWIIQPQTGDHGSMWFCRRTNLNLPTQELNSADFTLNIADGPGTSIALSPADTSYTKTEGDILPDITCTADCRPDCTSVWTRPDNTNFSVSPVLSLGQLVRSEHGMYKCTAGNVVGESTATVSVSVTYGPTTVILTPSTDSYIITEGQTIPKVICSADCNPTCSYSWTKDGQSHTTGSDLHLTNIQPNDEGIYKCTATNSNGNGVSNDITVTVDHGPGTSIALSPPDTTNTKTEGDTLLDITCTADCRPDCTFVWTRPDNTNFTVSPVLSLGQLARSEHGTYRCTARNAVGESTVTTRVIVQYGPGTSIALSPRDTTYTKTEGETLPDITCTADCRPDCTFVWTRPNNINFTVSPVLSLGQLERTEHGAYKCIARNVVEERTTTTTIVLQYGPSIVRLTPQTLTYTPHEDSTIPTITCSANCNPTCNYSWTKDGQFHTTGSDLHLTDIQRNEGGIYRCTATNKYGSRRTDDVSVTVYYGPGFPPSLSPPDTFYNRTEGDTLPDINCTAHCRPDCTFIWTLPDDTNIFVSPVLSLGHLDRSEQGTYSCTARNLVGEATTTINISITYAVTLTGSSQYAVPGSGFTLTCDVPDEAQGVRFYRRPEVTSPEGAVQVGGDQCYNINVASPVPCTSDVCSCVTSVGFGTVFRWIIQPQTGDHGSVWFCTRSNTNLPNPTLDSADFILKVASGPGTSIALSPPETSYTKTEGDTLPDITCTAECRPDCTFVWTRPDNTNFTVSPVLSLGQLARSEHGTYKCTARNVVGESTSTASVSVHYGPGDSISFEPQQDTVDVAENQTITDVTCSADCRPLCTYTWSKSGTNYPNPLRLSVATRTNAGQYTCTANNTVSHGTKMWNLIVRFPPRIIDLVYSQGDADVSEQESKSLICTVESYPPSTIQWLYKANNTILLNTPDVLDSTYTLTNAKCLDTGLYTCVVRNSVSTTAVSRDIPVNVLCKPRQDQRVALEHTFGLATSETLVIHARFLSNPEPSYSWSFQSPTTTDVTDLVDGRHNFNIQSSFVTMNLSAVSVGTRADIQESWFGVYNVTATNSQGSHTLSFTALAKENPRPPTNLSVSCGNPYSVDVSWNNGGYTNYFQVLYSTDNFIQSVTYPTNILEKKGESNDVYSLTIDNLEGNRLYFLKVIAYNSNANRTSFETAGCKVQEGKSCSTDSMYVTGVVLTCISGLMITLTFGLGIFISRKGRLPLTKGRCLKDKTFDDVQIHEQNVTTQGDDERPYQQLDRNDIDKPSVYSEIGKIGNQQQDTDNDTTDNRNYESLKGRSKANIYDELQNTASGSQCVYTNAT